MISDRPDLEKPVFSLMSCTSDVPVWVILLLVFFVVGLVVFLLAAMRHCNRAMADCNNARTLGDSDGLTGRWNRHVINRLAPSLV